MSMMPGNPAGDSGGAPPPPGPFAPPGPPVPAPPPTTPRTGILEGVGELLDCLSCCSTLGGILLVLGVLALYGGGAAIRRLQRRA